jgi:hypothetical protein
LPPLELMKRQPIASQSAVGFSESTLRRGT